jgi:hypothetical protein
MIMAIKFYKIGSIAFLIGFSLPLWSIALPHFKLWNDLDTPIYFALQQKSLGTRDILTQWRDIKFYKLEPKKSATLESNAGFDIDINKETNLFIGEPDANVGIMLGQSPVTLYKFAPGTNIYVSVKKTKEGGDSFSLFIEKNPLKLGLLLANKNATKIFVSGEKVVYAKLSETMKPEGKVLISERIESKEPKAEAPPLKKESLHEMQNLPDYEKSKEIYLLFPGIKQALKDDSSFNDQFERELKKGFLNVAQTFPEVILEINPQEFKIHVQEYKASIDEKREKIKKLSASSSSNDEEKNQIQAIEKEIDDSKKALRKLINVKYNTLYFEIFEQETDANERVQILKVARDSLFKRYGLSINLKVK